MKNNKCTIRPPYKNFTFGEGWCEEFKPKDASPLTQATESRRYAHGDIECIDAIKAALSPEEWRGFVKGNVLKYVWREAYKGGDCDLRKAADYLGRYLGKGGNVEPVEEG